jgi:hypothetical protein
MGRDEFPFASAKVVLGLFSSSEFPVQLPACGNILIALISRKSRSARTYQCSDTQAGISVAGPAIHVFTIIKSAKLVSTDTASAAYTIRIGAATIIRVTSGRSGLRQQEENQTAR